MKTNSSEDLLEEDSLEIVHFSNDILNLIINKNQMINFDILK